MRFESDQIATEFRQLSGCRECVTVDVALGDGRSGSVLVTVQALMHADLWNGVPHQRARAIARALTARGRRHSATEIIDGLTREPERERWLLRALT